MQTTYVFIVTLFLGSGESTSRCSRNAILDLQDEFIGQQTKEIVLDTQNFIGSLVTLKNRSEMLGSMADKFINKEIDMGTTLRLDMFSVADGQMAKVVKAKGTKWLDSCAVAFLDQPGKPAGVPLNFQSKAQLTEIKSMVKFANTTKLVISTELETAGISTDAGAFLTFFDDPSANYKTYLQHLGFYYEIAKDGSTKLLPLGTSELESLCFARAAEPYLSKEKWDEFVDFIEGTKLKEKLFTKFVSDLLVTITGLNSNSELKDAKKVEVPEIIKGTSHDAMVMISDQFWEGFTQSDVHLLKKYFENLESILEKFKIYFGKIEFTINDKELATLIQPVENKVDGNSFRLWRGVAFKPTSHQDFKLKGELSYFDFNNYVRIYKVSPFVVKDMFPRVSYFIEGPGHSVAGNEMGNIAGCRYANGYKLCHYSPPTTSTEMCSKVISGLTTTQSCPMTTLGHPKCVLATCPNIPENSVICSATEDATLKLACAGIELQEIEIEVGNTLLKGKGECSLEYEGEIIYGPEVALFKEIVTKEKVDVVIDELYENLNTVKNFGKENDHLILAVTIAAITSVVIAVIIAIACCTINTRCNVCNVFVSCIRKRPKGNNQATLAIQPEVSNMEMVPLNQFEQAPLNDRLFIQPAGQQGAALNFNVVNTSREQRRPLTIVSTQRVPPRARAQIYEL